MSFTILALRNMIFDALRLKKSTVAKKTTVYFVNGANEVSKLSGMYNDLDHSVDISSSSSKISLGKYPMLQDKKGKCIIAFHNSGVAQGPHNFYENGHEDYLSQKAVHMIVQTGLLKDLVNVDYTMVLVSFVLGMGVSSVLLSVLFSWLLMG